MSRRKGKRTRSAAQRRATAKLVAHNKHRKHRKHRKRKGYSMAKRKGRKAHHRKRQGGRRPRRSRGGGGGGYGIKPSGDDLKLMGAAALYGYLEGAAKTEQDHPLNKVPKPIDQLGFTGNVALLLWGASVLAKNRYVRLGARGVAMVAAYQMGRRGKLYDKGTDHFTISGWTDDDVADAIEAHVSGVNPYGQQEGY